MSTKIKSIKFTSTETFIGYVTSEQPRDCNSIINDKQMKRSDLPRHSEFERAMDKLKAHLLIANELQPAKDYNGNYLQNVHFNDFFADSDEENDRFGGLDVTGIIIHGKHAADGVQIFGTKTTSWGYVTPIKTGPIPLKRVADGWNYDLVEILDTQIDKLLYEADLYNQRKKHGAGLQTEIEYAGAKTPADAELGEVTQPRSKREQKVLEVV